jgi:hypothetical protein
LVGQQAQWRGGVDTPLVAFCGVQPELRFGLAREADRADELDADEQPESVESIVSLCGSAASEQGTSQEKNPHRNRAGLE